VSNLGLLNAVARRISPLLDEVVFVGGAASELFMSSPVSGRVRVTRDVDVLCEVASRVEYHRLGERLRAVGFHEDMTPGAPLCRWRSDIGILDLMPTDPEILGFSNPWYEYGIQTAEARQLDGDVSIRVVTATVFVATKLAAYEGRGDGDLLRSHDMEDIINVVAFRPELTSEFVRENPSIRGWVAARVREHLIENPLGESAIAGNLPDARLSPSLIEVTVDRLRSICALD
jgi:hypothetical protein